MRNSPFHQANLVMQVTNASVMQLTTDMQHLHNEVLGSVNALTEVHQQILHQHDSIPPTNPPPASANSASSLSTSS